MAKKDKESTKKGFQIPIEESAESAANKDVAHENVASKDSVSKEATSKEVTSEKAANKESTSKKTASKEATSEKTKDDKASDSSKVEAQVKAEATETSDDNLVAEAEAIVEEVSAAEQLVAAQTEAQNWQDRYMRLHAEWDTYRRRTGEQRAEEKLRATESLMEDLLPVLDDFARTVVYAEENGESGLLDGVKAVQTKLSNVLSKNGLVEINPVGQPYNALEAQSVAVVPDKEAFDETVAEVYQKGYKMGKKVLRSAMVTVTSGGPQRPKEESEDE